MVVGLLLIQSGLGVTFLSLCNASKSAWLFYLKEEKEGMKYPSSMFSKLFREREKYKSFLKY